METSLGSLTILSVTSEGMCAFPPESPRLLSDWSQISKGAHLHQGRSRSLTELKVMAATWLLDTFC